MHPLRALALAALLTLPSSAPPSAPPSGAGPAQDRDAGTAPEGEEPGAGLAAPESLAPLARVLLHSRMQRHGDDLDALLRAVLLLQRPRVVELASQLAAEPSLAHAPADGADTLNAALPPRYFELEDALHREAAALAEAAGAGDDDAALAAHFGRLTQVCVSCHQVYQRSGRTP